MLQDREVFLVVLLIKNAFLCAYSTSPPCTVNVEPCEETYGVSASEFEESMDGGDCPIG